MKIGNWPLVMLAVEWIIKNPKLHSQGVYRMHVDTNEGCGNSECCEYQEGYTVRCLAGWIAFFARYRDISRTDYVLLPDSDDAVLIETAAMTALELDPEIFGTDFERQDKYTTDAIEISQMLFDGLLAWDDVLGYVFDLAAGDGVTLTPVITAELDRLGVHSTEEL